MTSSLELFSTVFNYFIFIFVLIFSLAIGIYYSFQQKTTEEYVHGGHNMGLVPSSISLVVSYVSALTLQGMPAEIYMYGIEITATVIAAFGMLLVNTTFLPIFYELRYTSVFQYLEERFESNKPKLLGLWLNVISGLLYAGIICFGPASAIESLTGIPTSYNIIAMTVICMIYTSIGGIRAVIWTDVFQAGVMLCGMVTVIVVGMCNLNLSNLWHDMSRYGRTDIHFDLKLTQRSSFWIFVFLGGLSRYSMFCSQAAMIRYTSLPTFRQAKVSAIISTFGFMFLIVLASIVGIVVLGFYAQRGCGPLATGDIYSSNQIVPHFVVDVINYPGVPGLFISAIVASTLSSISSTQNAIGTTFWKDVLSKLITTSTEFRKTLALKITIFMFSLLSMGISFIAMMAGGTIFYAASITLGVVTTPPFGMFLLGSCFTFTSASATVIGCICSTLFLLWLSLGKLIYGTVWKEPSLIDDMCYLYTNLTINVSENIYKTSNYVNVTDTGVNVDQSGMIYLYSISAYAYPLIGTGLTVIIGLILSFVPQLRHTRPVDPKLLFPFLRRFVKPRVSRREIKYFSPHLSVSVEKQGSKCDIIRTPVNDTDPEHKVIQHEMKAFMNSDDN